MSYARQTMSVDRSHLGLWDRVTTLVAWASAAALFLTVGWTAMAPLDPLGPVSLLTHGSSALMYVQAVALAALAAGFATLCAGRRLADIGPFAATLGMAAVALRGATAESLLVHRSDISDSVERGLAVSFALESIAWIAAVIVVILVSSAIAYWCFGPRRGTAGTKQPKLSADADQPIAAGFDAPIVAERWLGFSTAQQSGVRVGIRHTVTAAGVGLIAMAILAAGLSGRAIQHGQVCFVVAASVMLGVYFSYRGAPVRSALWSILAVGVMALVGYAWAAVRPINPTLPPNIPSSHFLRILPIQFISVGTAAAVTAFWYVYTPSHLVGAEPQRPQQSTSRGGARR